MIQSKDLMIGAYHYVSFMGLLTLLRMKLFLSFMKVNYELIRVVTKMSVEGT